MFPPIHPDDPPERRGHREPWHVGLMVPQSRAITVAKRLFPDEIADGSDCLSEVGREGEPCRHCAHINSNWSERVRQVRLAMMEAFK
jgi:hypothetical protein